MRSIFIIACSILLSVSYGQRVSELSHNFGKVKLWNNPVFETIYTNTSNETQLFLPIRYQHDILVSYKKNKLAPGESTTIKIQYYTQEFGRFSKTIKVYISTQGEPIVFSIKGSIQSFHPDAMDECPRIENKDGATKGFVTTILVKDTDTKELITDYNLSIFTRSSSENIVVTQKELTLKRDKPENYFFAIEKEGYVQVSQEVYLQRNTSETTFYLKRIEVPESVVSDTIPEEIVAIATPPKDTIPTTILKEEEEVETVFVMRPPAIDTADYTKDGTLNAQKYAYNNIVFLIDVSTSMRNDDKLPLLKHSMRKMIEVLRAEDRVTIITYSTDAIVVADRVSGDQKQELIDLVESLEAKGQSYGQQGVNLAYDKAKEHFIEGGNNEIILASDGVFNSRNFSESRLYRRASLQNTLYDVRISTIGFGTSRKALVFLEALANKGKGSFIVIESRDEADTKLIENVMQHSIKI